MTVVYDIYPDLNLIIYVCMGSVSAVDFFNIGDQVPQDSRFHANLNIMIDFFDAELETSVSDLRLAVRKHSESDQRGHAVGRTAVLTNSRALVHLGEALKVISLDTISNFRVFHNTGDAVRWLNLSEAEALAGWQETRLKAEAAVS